MKNKIKMQKLMPYILLSPTIIFYLLFWLRPVTSAVGESFTDLEGNFSLGNFTAMFSEPTFLTGFMNTLIFTFISVIVQFVLAFAMALLLNKKFKGSNLVLFVAMIPMAIPPTAIAILWETGLSSVGWINSLLSQFGLADATTPIQWLGFEGMDALLLLVAIDTWTVLPSVMIIILAGLQNLDHSYAEAGSVFGASKWQIVKDIIYPILKPSIMTSLILRMISALQVWQIAVMLFGYGRVPFLVERVAYYNEMVPGLENSTKMAMTYSIFVTAIVVVFTFIYLRVNSKGASK